jgi:hypothetical protein
MRRENGDGIAEENDGEGGNMKGKRRRGKDNQRRNGSKS